MELQIDKEEATLVGFLFYVAACMWFTSIVTAFLILPLALFAWAWIFQSRPPYAVCMIAKDKEKCLTVMEDVAESLGVDQVIIYEAVGENEDDYKHLGTLNLQPEVEVELDLDDDQED